MAGIEEAEEFEAQEKKEEEEDGYDLTRRRTTRHAPHQKALDEDEAPHIRHAVEPHLPDQTDDVVYNATGH